MERDFQTRKQSSVFSEDNVSDLKIDCDIDAKVYGVLHKKKKTSPKTTRAATTVRTGGAMLPGGDGEVHQDTVKDEVISSKISHSCAVNQINVDEKELDKKEEEQKEGRHSLYQRRLAKNRKTAQKRRDRNRKYIHNLSTKRDQLGQLNCHLKHDNNLMKHQISVLTRMMLSEQQRQRNQHADLLRYQPYQHNRQMTQHKMMSQQQNPHVQKYGGQELAGQELAGQRATFVATLQYTNQHPPHTAKQILCVPTAISMQQAPQEPASSGNDKTSHGHDEQL